MRLACEGPAQSRAGVCGVHVALVLWEGWEAHMVEPLGEGPELGLHGPGQQPVAVQAHILCSVLGGHRDLHTQPRSMGCVLHASAPDHSLPLTVRHQATGLRQAVCLGRPMCALSRPGSRG